MLSKHGRIWARLKPNAHKPTIAIDARLAGGTHTGDSTYWLGLLKGLSEIEWNGHFLLYSNAARPQGIPDDPRFQWIRLPSRNQRWWSLVRFPLAARRAGASAIHGQYNLSPFCGHRGITMIHDVSFFIGPEWFKPKDRALLRRFVPQSAARAAAILTVSQTSKSEIESHIPAARGKTEVTPLALNPGITPLDRETAGKIVERDFGVSGDYLLAVGTRWPRKNISLAVEAASLLPESNSKTLVLTGKSGWGETAHQGPVVETGYVSDRQLSALYSAATLYLLPSFHEGFGLTLLEAFACQCPVLASSGGAIPETAGDGAAIELSWNARDWADRIQRLLSDSGTLDVMRMKGLQRLSQFNWRETARLTVQTYDRVVR